MVKTEPNCPCWTGFTSDNYGGYIDKDGIVWRGNWGYCQHCGTKAK